MPWQRHVLDVALEYDPATGRLVYRQVILTVPRQSGKTTLILALALHRALDPFFVPRQRIVYTAQTGKDARKKWLDDYLEIIKESPRLVENRDYKISLASGGECVTFPKRRAKFSPTASTKKSGHGGTLDLAFVDEAFAQVDDRLEQAFKPAMITRPQPQTWIVSTAGDISSVYLRAKVTRGRELVAAGVTKGTAYFEWSAPEGADPTDRQVWLDCMPAIGHTIDIEAVEADFDTMERPEFQRAYLNQWVDGKADPVLDPLMWSGLAVEGRSSPVKAPFAYAVDMTPLRTQSALTVCGRRVEDDIPQVEVIQHSPGSSWVVPRLLDVMAKNGKGKVGINVNGPAASLIPELEDAGVEVVRISTTDMAAACGLFFDAYMLGALRHCGQAELDLAAAASQKRAMGDAWGWDRRDAALDISPLVSVTIAHWLLVSQPKRSILDSIW